jgi:hypothetical protein
MDINALLRQYSTQVGRYLVAVDDHLDLIEKETVEFVNKYGFYFEMRAAFRAAKREQLYNDESIDKEKIGSKVYEFATSTLANALRTKAASINLSLSKIEAVDVIRYVYRYKLDASNTDSWPTNLAPRHWACAIETALDAVQMLKKSTLDAKTFQLEMATTLARQQLMTVLERAGASNDVITESMAINFGAILAAEQDEDDEIVLADSLLDRTQASNTTAPATTATVAKAAPATTRPQFKAHWNSQRKRTRLHDGDVSDHSSVQDDAHSDMTDQDLPITTNMGIKNAIKLLHDLGLFKTYVRLSADDQLAANIVVPAIMAQPDILHGINNAILTPEGCATLEQMEELNAEQFMHTYQLLQSCKNLSSAQYAQVLTFVQQL